MNKKFMDLAFKQAEKALKMDEVPVGAVIVMNNNVISTGFNKKESTNSVISHAEIKAILDAERKLGNWRLNECDLYVTLDPCPMCASAIKQSRIKNVYSAMKNSDSNNFLIISQIFNESDSLNNVVNFETDMNISYSSKLLSDFFIKKR